VRGGVTCVGCTNSRVEFSPRAWDLIFVHFDRHSDQLEQGHGNHVNLVRMGPFPFV
jgi:hypothetical protein